MLRLKNERGLTAARVEFTGETRDPEQNRLVMQWLRLFPIPSLIELHVDGDRVGICNLNAGHSDFKHFSTTVSSDERVVNINTGSTAAGDKQ